MKNFEAYKDYISKRGTNVMAIKNGEAIDCVGTPCEECLFESPNECNKRKGKWLYEEYKKPKIKIPLATKVILESLDEKWKWIAKDEDKVVHCYENKPKKSSSFPQWRVDGLGGIISFRNCLKKEVFDFLSWEDEEPINIKELLENCEVVEDE